MSSTPPKGKRLARVISSKKVLTSPHFEVFFEQVEEPGGTKVQRHIVRHPGSVVILALDERSRPPRVLLERQYRHAAGVWMWELPAGSLDPGEAPLAGAQRELEEETGYSASRWQKVLFFYVSPGFLSESMDVYLARGLKKGEAHPEEDERIVVRLFPVTEAVKMVIAGKIIDAKTVAALLWLGKSLAEKSTSLE